MSPQERTELVQTLERSREEFNALIAGVSDTHAKAKPDPERWSILECVEHVAVVEGRFLGMLQEAPRSETPRVDKEREAQLAVMVPNRETKAQAPEQARPTGRFATLADAVAEFNAARDRSIHFAQERAGELHSMTLQHRRFGPANGAEFMQIVAGHSRRHGAQIRELRAALGLE